jgi:hypothetical protein
LTDFGASLAAVSMRRARRYRLVSDGEVLSNIDDSIAGLVVSEIHVCRSFRPTTASAWRPGALSGSVNRYSCEFETVQSGPDYVVGLETGRTYRVKVDDEEMAELRADAGGILALDLPAAHNLGVRIR